jgi:hypothetical protein
MDVHTPLLLGFLIPGFRYDLRDFGIPHLITLTPLFPQAFLRGKPGGLHDRIETGFARKKWRQSHPFV